jgi:hypothetical protein
MQIEIQGGLVVDTLLKEENVMVEMWKIVFIKNMTRKEHQSVTEILNLSKYLIHISVLSNKDC